MRWRQLVEALRYKPEVHGFESQCFKRPNLSGRTVAMPSTLCVIEMSTVSVVGNKGGRCVGLTTFSSSSADCVDILGVPTSCNPKGQSKLLQGFLYFLFLDSEL